MQTTEHPPAGERARATALPPALLGLLRNVSHGANDIYWFILPPALPLILEEFGLRYTAAGGMIAAFLCMTAVASMATGRLSDRVHRTRLIGAGFILASAMLGLGAAMPSLALVVACLVACGIGVSTYHPAAYAAIHETGGGQGRSYGTFEASGAVALVAMLAVHGLLLHRIGWRGVLAVGAVPGMLVGLFLLAVPGSMGGAASRSAQSPSPAQAPALPPAEPRPGRSLLPALFVVGVMFRVLGVTAIQNFIPTYLVRSVGIGESFATYALGLTFLGGMVGAFTMGRLADRSGPFPVFLTATAALVPLVALLGLRLPPWCYALLLVLFGFAAYASFPPQNMILTALASSGGKGQLFGVLMGMTTFMASASPLLFGMVADSAGLVAAVRLSAAPIALATVVAVAVRLRLRGQVPAQTGMRA